MSLSGLKIGFGLCGSFCTFEKAFKSAENLVKAGADVIPIMSFNASGISTRFGSAETNCKRLEDICSHDIINSIEGAEPIGPKKMLDILVVAPCTANTLAKLALGITDTPITMAVKSHLRNSRNVLLGVSTNDALSNSAESIGKLFSRKHFYFIPMGQDDYKNKPFSLVCDFERTYEAAISALQNEQIQPLFI